ncbi:uncharacterized protein LOC121774074 [Salvia splendens]|uniref:uncharacterized protein LOC121774074 n=1 Tax=Salvia splendens TaxID=180675 RepID=UPI001C258EA5|nr:uncharacterized protein LOC121774074 [Salvia splendens]
MGEQVAQRVNKGRKKILFNPGDWVWVDLRKILFPDKARSKLASREDDPFMVLERVNDNVYIIDLPGEYNVSCTFNVADLSPFDFVGDDPNLRTNPSQEGEDDTNGRSKAKADATTTPLRLPGRPVTRSMRQKLREGVSNFIRSAMDEADGTPGRTNPPLQNARLGVCALTVIHVLESLPGRANSPVQKARPGV